jgi:hypothetical protein
VNNFTRHLGYFRNGICLFFTRATAITADATHLLAVDYSNDALHFISIVNDVESDDVGVPVNLGPKSYDQFTMPDDRIFVSEIGSTATGG